MIKNTYRHDIDGLRGLAVLFVLAYHSQVSPYFEGGYIGVDIFFVISGYLIFSLIYNETASNQFSLLLFYERRARRIIPALIILIFCLIPFVYFYFLPQDIIKFSKSLISVLFFFSNYFFYFASLDYFNQFNLLEPLLHTWSLSIEEQFYVFFPILIIFLFKHNNKRLKFYLIFFFIVAFCVSNIQTFYDNNLAFYSLHTRIWELTFGAILRIFEINLSEKNKKDFLSKIFKVFGFFLIAISFFIFEKQTFHPSFLTLVPIFGTGLIIIFSNNQHFITRILSNKFLTEIGKISYSLYLWHFAIFAIHRHINLTDGEILKKIFLVIFIFLISWLSHQLIEKNFRDQKKVSRKKFFLFLIFSYIIIFLFCAYVLIKNGKVNALNTAIHEAKILKINDNNECKIHINEKNFFNSNIFLNRVEDCKKKYPKMIVIIGDSHGENLFNAATHYLQSKFIIGLNIKGCRFYERTDINCHQSKSLEFIKNNRRLISAVFFKSKSSYLLTDESKGAHPSNPKYRKLPIIKENIDGELEYLSKVSNFIDKVFYFGPHVEPNILINRNIFNRIKERKLKNFENKDLNILDKELKLLFNNKKVKYISLMQLINYNSDIDFYVDGKFTYTDTDHWSNFGEVYFGSRIFEHPKLSIY